MSLIASVSVAGANGGTTAGIDTTGADLLVAVIGSFTGVSMTKMSDSKSNIWHALKIFGTSSSTFTQFFVSFPYVVGTSHTFTTNEASSFSAMNVMAFSAAPLLQNVIGATSGSGGTSFQPGSLTPGANGALIVTGLCLHNTYANLAIDNGFTIAEAVQYSAGVNLASAAAYLFQPTAAASNPTWSWTNSLQRSVDQAVFLPVSSGGGIRRARSPSGLGAMA